MLCNLSTKLAEPVGVTAKLPATVAAALQIMTSVPKPAEQLSVVNRPKRLKTTQPPRYEDEFAPSVRAKHDIPAVQAITSATKPVQHFSVVNRPKRLIITRPTRYEDEFTSLIHSKPAICAAIQPMTNTSSSKAAQLKQSLELPQFKVCA